MILFNDFVDAQYSARPAIIASASRDLFFESKKASLFGEWIESLQGQELSVRDCHYIIAQYFFTTGSNDMKPLDAVRILARLDRYKNVELPAGVLTSASWEHFVNRILPTAPDAHAIQDRLNALPEAYFDL